MGEAPTNGIGYRVSSLERRVGRLEDGRPDVIAERVSTLSRDSRNLRAETKAEVKEIDRKVDELADKLDGQRRVLQGLLVTIAGSAVMIIVAQVLLQR